MKYAVLIIVFTSLRAHAQDPDQIQHDSILNYISNQHTSFVKFIATESDGKKYHKAEYHCDVNQNTIVRMERYYKSGRKSKKEADTTHHKDVIMLYNGHLFEFFHSEWTDYYTLKGKKVLTKNQGETQEMTCKFNNGQLFYNATQGQGPLSSANPLEFAEGVFAEMLLTVQTKYPKWH